MNNKKGKVLHQLGFKITDLFLSNTNYNVYKTDDKLVEVVDLIRSYSKDKLRGEWEASNVLRIPFTVNSVNPVGLMMRADGKDEDFIEFYCHSTLSQKEIQRAMYLISNSINEFIDKHREGLEEYNIKGIDIDNIDFDCTLRGSIDTKFLKENTALIKALFVRELSNHKIKIGVSDNEKYITEGKELQFYPCYSKQGHELISEVVELDIKGKIQKLSFYIQPNIEAIDGELYIFPIIGVKRFIEAKNTKKAIQWGEYKSNHSILIFDGENYHSPSVRWDSKDKEVKPLSKEYKLYKYIEDYKNISYDEIKCILNSEEDSNTILLPYNNRLGVNSKLGSGVSTVDKFDVFNYIINNIEGLDPIKEISNCLWKKGTDFSNISPSNSKLILNNCIYRNDKTDITLHIMYDKNRKDSFYDEVIKVIEESLIDKNNGLKIQSKGSYILEVADSKDIHIKVKDNPIVDCLVPTWERETLEDRTSMILKEIKLEGRLNIALVELEWRNDKTDAKSIVRGALNRLGLVNQFITPKDKGAKNEIRSAILDLFNDIGFGNRVQLLEDDTVIYTMHKINGIEVIGRLNNETVEVSIPGTCEFKHITEIPSILSGGVSTNDVDAMGDFISILENESRRKIVILEGGEVQKNSVVNSMDISLINKIESLCDVYVSTDLLNREVVQTNNREVTFGVAYYKVNDGVYISIGDRVKGKVVVQSSKIREWINTKGNVSTGATAEYKDRIAYEIRVKGNYDDSMCRLVHNLRLNTNTHIHLNRSVLVDYIIKLSKHIGGNKCEK